MTTIYLNLLLLNLLITLVYYLNAPQGLANRLIEIVTKGKIRQVELKKPWSCPICMCNWLSFIYLLIVMPIYQIILICLLSVLNGFLTKFGSYAIQLIDQLVSHIAILFERLINKIR